MKNSNKKIITIAASFLTGTIIGNVINIWKCIGQDKKVERLEGYYDLLNDWLELRQHGKTLEQYFIENDYKEIVIYGFGELGMHLYEELKSSHVNVKYAIDKNCQGAYCGLDITDINQEIDDKAEIVVVTPTFAFDEIKDSIQDKFICPIVSLKEIITECM